MRSALAAAVLLALLAATAALTADPAGTGGGAAAPASAQEGVPLALEVQASLAVGREEVPCPGRAGDCQRLLWRPNVQASAVVPGAYQARSRLEGTDVANACSFTSPVDVSCNDTATDPRTSRSFSEVVPEDRGEVCRRAEATLTSAGVWVDTNSTRRCVDVPDPEE